MKYIIFIGSLLLIAVISSACGGTKVYERSATVSNTTVTVEVDGVEVNDPLPILIEDLVAFPLADEGMIRVTLENGGFKNADEGSTETTSQCVKSAGDGKYYCEGGKYTFRVKVTQ